MEKPSLLILDMDGVLVDVTDSYRQAIVEAVKHFTGEAISHTEIQAAKNRGGSNNDWDLTLELVRERGGSPTREKVIEVFQRIYLGDDCNGLIARERWLARDGLFERLSRRFRLALFTGRERWEALFTLSKFAPGIVFDPVVGMEDVAREKPDPEGLLKILRAVDPQEAYYVGDAMDDCRAARAAGVPFIGVVAPQNPLRDQLDRLFRQEGARAVIAAVNDLEPILL